MASRLSVKSIERANHITAAIADFEIKAKKQEKFKESMVKRNAAEKDLLKSVEKLRDHLTLAVKGDKKALETNFGTGTSCFWRIKSVMDGTELSETHANDQRWRMLGEAMDIIEEVLKTLGQYVAYKGQSPPDSLEYRDFESEPVPERLAPGHKYDFTAHTSGCEAESLNFSVQPSLPPNLKLDPAAGDISGHLMKEFTCNERTWTVTAANSAGSCEAKLVFSVGCVRPHEIHYGRPEMTTTIGKKVNWKPLPLTTEGDAADIYEISPDLPDGLSLDPETGDITGCAGYPTDPETYTVSSKNGAGESKSSFTLQVLTAPPSKLEYPELLQGDLALGQVCYFIPEVHLGAPGEMGRSMTLTMRDRSDTLAWGRNFASSGMTVGTKWGKGREAAFEAMMLKGVLPDLRFDSTPPLPKGLHLAHNTGIINGKLAEESKKQVYKITCSNNVGKTSIDIRWGVVQKAPARLKYPEVPDVIYDGQPLTLTPEVENLPTGWAVEPELPSGLVLDPQMGQISGIPSGVCAKTSFKVTASNAGGDCTTELELTVQRMPPSSFAYQDAASEYPVGKPLELVAKVEGSVQEFTIEGQLPKGLEFDPKTGRLSGTPLEPSAKQWYALEAKNESGVVKAMLEFEIKEMPPSDLYYPRVDSLYHIGEKVDCKPALVGGATEWSIEPPLPEGMTFDAASGAISGVPAKEAQETSYTVTATNATGGTSTVIDFAIAAVAPESLSYHGQDNLCVGRPVLIEPELHGAVKETEVSYVCDQALPEGLDLDTKTGIISGTPAQGFSKTKYNITASTSGGSVTCSVDLGVGAAIVQNPPPLEQTSSARRPSAADVDVDFEAFAAKLEEITDVSNLPPSPGMENTKCWMAWMVHRIWLNDPSLDVLDFTNMEMPLPHDEPRIAPKLMKALASNTTLKKLFLASSNLRSPQAHHLSEAIKHNMALQELNIESNWLDPEALKAVAAGLKSENCNNGQLSIVKMANQVGLPSVGRPIEQALAEALQANKVILRFGFACDDPHWNDVIARALIRNTDLARRKRKGLGDGSATTSKQVAKERSLDRLELIAPPEQAIWEIVDDDDKNILIVRRFAAEKKMLPTSKQLQAYAAGLDTKIPFGQIAALMKTFQTQLLDAFKNHSIKLTSTKDGTDEGNLIAWSEKNQRWCVEVKTEGGAFFKYLSDKQIGISISDPVADWLEAGD